MPSSEEAAATAAATLIGGTEEAVEETPSGEVTETTEETQAEMPEFNIELPADLLAELEEFDEETIEDDDEEIAALAEQYGEDNPELLKRLRLAEKKAEHMERLRLADAKKNWQEEAEKFFPLSQPFLNEIQQTSRRGYLRTAKGIHDRMLPIVEEKVLKPARDSIAAAKAEATTEAKGEARKAWGQPVSDESISSEVRVTQETVNARRNRRELSDVIRGMIFPVKESA